MNILDFEFSNLDDSFKLHKKFEVVGPTAEELFKGFDRDGEIGMDAEDKFGSTLDFGGEMTKDHKSARVGWCSSEVENGGDAQRIIDFMTQQVEQTYGWQLKPL